MPKYKIEKEEFYIPNKHHNDLVNDNATMKEYINELYEAKMKDSYRDFLNGDFLNAYSYYENSKILAENINCSLCGILLKKTHSEIKSLTETGVTRILCNDCKTFIVARLIDKMVMEQINMRLANEITAKSFCNICVRHFNACVCASSKSLKILEK